MLHREDFAAYLEDRFADSPLVLFRRFWQSQADCTEPFNGITAHLAVALVGGNIPGIAKRILNSAAPIPVIMVGWLIDAGSPGLEGALVDHINIWDVEIQH